MSLLADPLLLMVASAAFGLVVGVLSGLLGVGGGTLMIPAFRLLFGMSPTVCAATSLFAIVPTSFSGAVQHRRNGTCVLPVALAAGIGGALTSPLGAVLAQRSPGWLIMLVAALIIGYTALNMLRKAAKMPKNPQGSEPKKTQGDAPDVAVERKQLALSAGIGVIAGVASGFAGIGGGFLMVPLFLSMLGLSMKQASGTSLAAIIVLATPGVVTQMMLGNVNYFAGIAVVCGTIPGAFLGALLTKHVPDRSLRFAFGGFLLFGALMLAMNELALIA